MCGLHPAHTAWMLFLPAGRHVMLLQYANRYAGSGHSNAKYNTKYSFFWTLGAWGTYSADLVK